MSRFSSIFFVAIAAIFLGGCGTLKFERSRLHGDRLENPTLGRGMYYRIPEGYMQVDPRSPELPELDNIDFEMFLRAMVWEHDRRPGQDGFREALLFRRENRYLIVIHSSLNLPWNLNDLDARRMGEVFGILTTMTCRYFKTRPGDFDYTASALQGQTTIYYQPFRPGLGAPSGEEWRGVGFNMLGNVRDVATVFVFARAEEVEAAQIDLNRLIAGFRYGSPPSD